MCLIGRSVYTDNGVSIETLGSCRFHILLATSSGHEPIKVSGLWFVAKAFLQRSSSPDLFIWKRAER